MSGEELYQLYIDANGEDAVTVDTWEELDSQEQTVWERIAQRLANEF